MTNAYVPSTGYVRSKIREVNGRTVYHSWAPSLGSWYWVGRECANFEYQPYGGKTFDRQADAIAYAESLPEA